MTNSIFRACIKSIFNAFTPRENRPINLSRPSEDEILFNSQAPGMNLMVQPSSPPSSDDSLTHAEHIQENQNCAKIIENRDRRIGVSEVAEDHLKVIENPDPILVPNDVIRTLHEHRLYALIIGIDAYSSVVGPLNAAVADAIAVQEFLKSYLNVPPGRINLLLDSAASRKKIINAFKQLSEEEKIGRDDPILIYYAGHGSQLQPPQNWHAGGKERQIQAICPCDYDPEIVNVIPDWTIGALLDLICKKKGNNITVIFDCCYSSSGTRVEALGTKVRGVELVNESKFPVDLDLQDLWTSMGHGSRVAIQRGMQGLGSHVLIAACKETETARETNKGGRFTVALLELLKLFHQDGRLKTLTYTDILKYVRQIPGQNPQVEGIHRDRIIFDTKEAGDRHYHLFRFVIDETTLLLNAGSVHGIANDSIFTIYEDDSSLLKSHHWGSLRVLKVKEFTSEFCLLPPCSEKKLDINLAKSIAVLSVGGKDQALMASYDREKLPSNFRGTVQLMEDQRMISLVTENAKVQMQLQSNDLIFNIIDPSLKRYGLDRVLRIAKPATADDVAHILSAGRSFFWHLRPGLNHDLLEHLKVEFMELHESTEKLGPAGYPILLPSADLIRQDGTIDLQVGSVKPGKPYGIKLTNDSPWDLFPAVFYFDHSEWSIDEYYHSGTAGQFETEAPLQKRGGTLTVGYGAGGHDPICFHLNQEYYDLDVGHLKIFFSTKAVEIRHIQQKSPFTGDRPAGRWQPSSVPNIWVSLQYPIIQRRA